MCWANPNPSSMGSSKISLGPMGTLATLDLWCRFSLARLRVDSISNFISEELE
jgi:hypothetical protein